MSDADGDSTMHSSPEPDDVDEMFPDEGGPSTPRNAATYHVNPASELSPPNSQGPPLLPRDDRFSASFSGTPSALNSNGKRVHSAAVPTSGGAEVPHMDSETGYQWSKQEEQPGWDWKNPRAKDEEFRALDQIVDKGSQIKARYGDPLDASIPAVKSKR